MNSKLALLLCPPLLLSCGGGEGSASESVPEPVREAAATVGALPLPPLPVTPVAPAKRALLVEGDMEVRLDTVTVAEGDSVAAGDTLAMAVDTLSVLEAQRVRMEADFLRQSPETDSSRLDSLLSLAGELEVPAPLMARRRGVLVELRAQAGLRLGPGDTLALLQSGEAATRLRLPPGARLDIWPPLAGAGPVETTDSTAVYSVPPPDRDSLRLEGLWRVPRNTLRDEGLRSFVTLAGGDTVSVRRMGSWDGAVVVAGPLEGAQLQTW